MASPGNILALKHNGKFLGVNQPAHNYLLGFYRPEHARRVCGIIGDTPQVLIKSAPQMNISREVKVTLLGLDMPIYRVKDEIFMDNEAHVAFKKTAPLADAEITSIPVDRFLSLPYINEFGLVIPYDMVGEDDTYVLYKANLIDCFYRA